MRRLLVPLVALLVLAVGAKQAGGVATLHVQVSGSGSVTSNPAGISCPQECAEQFDSDSRVVLTAHPGMNESFLGWGGACSGSSATCTVVADVEKNVAAKFTPGTLPAITIDDVSVVETNFDIVADLHVTLAPATTETVTVHYDTSDGTADSTDYVADSGTLTFTPGTTASHLPVLIKGDALDEPDETVFVDLSSPEHATIADGRGVVTIVDSDPTPLLVVNAAVQARWNVHRRYTRVTRFVVKRPAGATVEVNCVGLGCPFRVVALGGAPGVTHEFGRAKLRPGNRVEARVDYPGQIGKVFRYTIRTGKKPRAQTLCFPPAATKPTAC